ncbi:hypothetical protein AWENTII_004186 [Aspergillus wentii]
MLQQTASNTPYPRSTVDEKKPEISANLLSRRFHSDGRTDRRADLQMNEGRASGELEGSTLGSSSRDGAQNHPRRAPSSSGFLLDSSFMPRSSRSFRAGHRPRRSEPADRKEKRGAPEPDIAAPKKKSRFPWSRHRNSQGENASVTGTAGSEAFQQSPSSPSDVYQQRDSHEAETTDADPAEIGLDKDSLQIVNLALNLSDSRKRNSLGRSASHRVSGRWAASGPSSVPYVAPAAVGSVGQRAPQAHRSLDDPGARPGLNEPTSVLNLLPNTAGNDALSYEFSDSTLARAEKARRHFELFSEYLRLLPSLPPLKQRAIDTASAAPSGQSNRAHSHRVYNPLQSIRNRKVRFREKRPINTEAEGWDDVRKVHEWINNVEGQYSHHTHSPFECLSLPTFQLGETPTSPRGSEDVEMFAGSPPSSLRRVSRTGSVKARRPRFDWAIPPAELLCDAAWTEDPQNKSKIVDKDGNHLYPDPGDLVSPDVNPQTGQNLANRDSVDTGQPASHTSFSDSQHGASKVSKNVSRGRQLYRYSSPSNAVPSSSVSTKDTDFGRHKTRKRSISSSNMSIADDRHSYDKDSRSYWNSHMDSPQFSGKHRLPSPHASRAKGPSPLPEEDNDDDPNQMPAQSSGPSSYRSGWAKHDEKRASMSSVASYEDPSIPRMSLDAMDSTAPNSPAAHPGYFPSIAVNLSPPSSRSPSPSKRAFPRKIVHRHERNKSKHRTKESRDRVEDSPLDNEALRKHLPLGLSDTSDRVGKLEPSPIPDRVSSYQEDQPTHEASKGSSQQESKLRGIFKGPGKIAGKVGNEVSKMGDYIKKKDHQPHSRQSSFASSVSSDSSLTDDNEDVKGDAKGDKSRSRKDTEKPVTKGPGQLPAFTSPSRQHGRESETNSPRGHEKDSQDTSATPRNKLDTYTLDKHAGGSGIGGALHNLRGHHKKHQIKDPSVPFSLTNPPVTGLAQARASPVPLSRQKRPTLSGTTSRTWSISDRSITTLADSGIPDKREVERPRALLLSSGIKAREITRRAESVRSPPPEFLRSSLGPNTSIPRVTRLYEFDLAAQSLVQRFEKSHYLFHQSMNRFPTETSSPLKSQLSSLEALVEQSLTPRAQAAAADAEQLSVHLNTTSTLAVKQLSDTLDKGLRRRRRRLRWLRRTGFVMLEWALVGMLWWVWLIVMAFKLLRGVFRGAISGIRWVFWL